MRWYERIIAAHTAVTNNVSHYKRLKSDRYFVWQEDGANDLVADNIHTAKVITGTTDLFTKKEFDPWIDELSASFNAYGISWYLNAVQYEDDTGFIHYEWVWQVDDGED
jgi:hypothetical protein